MPDTIFQFEQRLEPLIERFYCLAAASINAPASRTAVELSADKAAAMRLITWLNRLLARRALRVAFVLRADESPASAFSLFRPFHSLGQVITVIPAVGRNIFRRFGQIIDLVVEGGHFLGTGCIGRGQERENSTLSGGRHHHFKTVALHPAIVLGKSPLALAVHATKTFGNAVLLPVALVPQRAAGRYQTLVHGYVGGVRNAFGNRCFALQFNRISKQPVRSTIAIKVGAAGRKLLGTQPLLQLSAMLIEITVLCRLALFMFQHGDHNQYRQDPVSDLRLATWTGSRTLPLGSLAQRHGHFHQRRQTRARLGTLTHPWVLHRASVSTPQAET